MLCTLYDRMRQFKIQSLVRARHVVVSRDHTGKQGVAAVRWMRRVKSGARQCEGNQLEKFKRLINTVSRVDPERWRWGSWRSCCGRRSTRRNRKRRRNSLPRYVKKKITIEGKRVPFRAAGGEHVLNPPENMWLCSMSHPHVGCLEHVAQIMHSPEE